MALNRRIPFVALLVFVLFYFLLALLYSAPQRSPVVFLLPGNYSLPGFLLNESLWPGNSSSCPPPARAPHRVKYYRLKSIYYEYRYELSPRALSQNESRLVLLLAGRRRLCLDWWDFSIGEKILSSMRSAGFSILAICTSKRDYTVRLPVQRNQDVRLIYTTLQMWMRDVYYKVFRHYPRMYLFGVSQGSRMCALLSRVLPIQAQILYVYPGHRPSMLRPSDYEPNLYNRLALDATFANWFYFDYCDRKHASTKRPCPFFHATKNYLNPVPPTYFVHAEKDGTLNVSRYRQLMSEMRTHAVRLGGVPLTHDLSVQLSIAVRVVPTRDRLQKNFNKWTCKPWAARFLHEHFIKPIYTVKRRKHRTCWCMSRNFLYFTQFPNITRTWPAGIQEKFRDYVNDWRKYKIDLCQQLCGDIRAHHSMISQHIEKTVRWLDDIDHVRFQHKVYDLHRRPLRLWMYNKSELVANDRYLHAQTALRTSCGRDYQAHQMYSPEYFLLDYFQHLRDVAPQPRHNLIWSSDPLLADYFVIPHDYVCIATAHYRPTLTDAEYRAFYRQLNERYFSPLLAAVRERFPFWNMSAGANHLIAFTVGKNMAVVQDRAIKESLRNTIQLGLTGFRQDLAPPGSPPLYPHRNVTPMYRHHYDIVVPPFNRLEQPDEQPVGVEHTWSEWYARKKTLFFFAGALNKSASADGARLQLSAFLREKLSKVKRKTTIANKQFDTLVLIDGHQNRSDYLQSIRSSVFHLCLEGISPWSPRLYESIALGAIPLIIARSIVLPFERFVDWRGISAKLNLDNVSALVDIVTGIDRFEEHVQGKLTNATKFFHAFRWPYSPVDDTHDRHAFLPDADRNGTTSNVFHFLSRELRCRRLEQFYGLTSDSLSSVSQRARRRVCNGYPLVCPCAVEYV